MFSIGINGDAHVLKQRHGCIQAATEHSALQKQQRLCDEDGILKRSEMRFGLASMPVTDVV